MHPSTLIKNLTFYHNKRELRQFDLHNYNEATTVTLNKLNFFATELKDYSSQLHPALYRLTVIWCASIFSASTGVSTMKRVDSWNYLDLYRQLNTKCWHQATTRISRQSMCTNERICHELRTLHQHRCTVWFPRYKNYGWKTIVLIFIRKTYIDVICICLSWKMENVI